MKGKTKTILAIVLAVAIVAVAAVGTVTFLKDNGRASAVEEENNRTLPVTGNDETGANSGEQGTVPENLNGGETTEPDGTDETTDSRTTNAGTPTTQGTTRRNGGANVGIGGARNPEDLPVIEVIEQERLVSTTLNWSNINLNSNFARRNINYTNLKYTVNYYKGDELSESETGKGEFGTTVTVSDEDIDNHCPEGYMLDEESELSVEITENEDENVINVYYVPRTDTKYVVEHYLETLTNGKFEFKEKEDKTGTTDTEVTAEPKTYEGFTFDSKVEGTVESGIITGDGKLVLKLYYTRNSYKVIYYVDGEQDPTTEEHKYGEEVKAKEEPEKEGYTFTGWDKEDFTMPAEDVEIHGDFTPNPDTKYKVEHYLENLEDEEFTLKETENKTGTTDTEVTATAKTYEGFTFDSKVEGTVESGIIAGDGSLVLKLFYTRNTYKVTYKYEGTIPKDATALPKEATYKYGAQVTVAPAATAAGYTFSGWDKKDFTMPAEDVVIKGSFKANDDTKYKVEHYLQNLEDEEFTLKETENKTGTTDTEVTATAKTYEGFTFDSKVEETKLTGTIVGDGSLVLKLYYTRNSYKVTYKYDETAPKTASALPKESSYKYGASVAVAGPATADGYTFKGWSTEDATVAENKFTMPAKNVEFVGGFTANDDTKYKVEHYLQNLEDEGFTLKETENKAGTTDTEATATAKTYEGFTFDSKVEGTKLSGNIAGDGSLVLKLFYTRNTYKVTYKYEGTTPKDATALPKEATYKYGAAVTIAPAATAAGYTFSGWDKKDFTMPAEDVVIKGSFKANDNTKYTVEHYTETLTTGKFELRETENKAGTTDTEATATAKTYEGFTFDSTVEGTILSGTIAGDGSLVLKLFYTRNTYKVTYKYEGTTPKDATALPKEATYKYGAAVTIAPAATAAGYTFSGWDKKDFTMPAEDVVIKGSFKANDNTKYKVEHYLQNLEDEEFTLKETENKTGTTDTEATATAKTYEGFTFDSTVEGTILSGTIAGDGSLVLKLYYTRNIYQYTIKYYYEGIDGEFKLDEGATERGTAKYQDVINSYEPKTQGNKYALQRVTPVDEQGNLNLVIGTNANNNVIEVYYVRNMFEYKVQYYKDSINGELLGKTETAEEKLGTTLTEKLVAEDFGEGWINSYKPTEGYKNGEVVEYITIANNNNNVIKVVYKIRTDIPYTVKYFYNEVEDTSKEYSETGTYKANITAQDKSNNGEWTLDNQKTPTMVFTLASATSNVFKVYYVKPEITVNKVSTINNNRTDGKVEPGETITYELIATNNGYEEGTVEIADEVPAGSVLNGSITATGDNTQYTESDLNSGITLTVPAKSGNTSGIAKVIFTVTVTANAGETVKNDKATADSKPINSTEDKVEKTVTLTTKTSTTTITNSNVLIILDRSRSMVDGYVGSKTRWAVATGYEYNADGVVQRFINQVNLPQTLPTDGSGSKVEVILFNDNNPQILKWNYATTKIARTQADATTLKKELADAAHYPSGGTNFLKPLQTAKTELEAMANGSTNNNVVIFVSDGVKGESVGADSDAVKNAAQAIKNIPNTTVYSIGFEGGNDAIALIASDSSKYMYTDTNTSLESVFTTIAEQISTPADPTTPTSSNGLVELTNIDTTKNVTIKVNGVTTVENTVNNITQIIVDNGKYYLDLTKFAADATINVEYFTL